MNTDQVVEQLITGLRTCGNCGEVKKEKQFHGRSSVCRKCRIVNAREGKRKGPPGRSVEIGGMRVELCESCLKRYLRV